MNWKTNIGVLMILYHQEDLAYGYDNYSLASSYVESWDAKVVQCISLVNIDKPEGKVS